MGRVCDSPFIIKNSGISKCSGMKCKAWSSTVKGTAKENKALAFILSFGTVQIF